MSHTNGMRYVTILNGTWPRFITKAAQMSHTNAVLTIGLGKVVKNKF